MHLQTTIEIQLWRKLSLLIWECLIRYIASDTQRRPGVNMKCK